MGVLGAGCLRGAAVCLKDKIFSAQHCILLCKSLVKVFENKVEVFQVYIYLFLLYYGFKYS